MIGELEGGEVGERGAEGGELFVGGCHVVFEAEACVQMIVAKSANQFVSFKVSREEAFMS